MLLLATILVFTLDSCSPEKRFKKEEMELIYDFLAKNPDLAFEQKESGMYYLEILQGSGEFAKKSDTAYVKYAGKFLNGTIFDTNIGTTDTLIFLVDRGLLLPGFDEGITYMKKGGKATFILPSDLAYGIRGFYSMTGYSINGYTPLLFDVTLVDLK